MQLSLVSARLRGVSHIHSMVNLMWLGMPFGRETLDYPGVPELDQHPGTCQSSKSRHWAVVGGSKMSRLYPFPSWSNHLDRRHQFNPQALLLPMSFKTLVYLTQTPFQVYQFEAKYRKGMHESTDTCTFIFCCHFEKLKTHFRPFFCVLVYK